MKFILERLSFLPAAFKNFVLPRSVLHPFLGGDSKFLASLGPQMMGLSSAFLPGALSPRIHHGRGK